MNNLSFSSDETELIISVLCAARSVYQPMLGSHPNVQTTITHMNSVLKKLKHRKTNISVNELLAIKMALETVLDTASEMHFSPNDPAILAQKTLYSRVVSYCNDPDIVG